MMRYAVKMKKEGKLDGGTQAAVSQAARRRTISASFLKMKTFFFHHADRPLDPSRHLR